MAPRFDTITFLSDYGTGDEFVGVVHSVLRSIAPHAAVIDLTHEVPAYDVRAGSLTLGRAAQYLCPGVVLAVVDPGVGTERRAVAIEVGGGQSILVGPDNGLLASAVAMSGGATAVVELVDPAYQLDAPGPTFAGRDVFAPAAAHLAAGADLAALGPDVPAADLIEVHLAEPDVEHGKIGGEVLDVDRFGNVRLNVRPSHLAAAGLAEAAAVHIATLGQEADAPRISTYGSVGVGQYGVIVDAWEWIAIIRYEANAAADLGVQSGDVVWLTAAD
jgi:S-adenosylmethionine hydrolase